MTNRAQKYAQFVIVNSITYYVIVVNDFKGIIRGINKKRNRFMLEITK